MGDEGTAAATHTENDPNEPKKHPPLKFKLRIKSASNVETRSTFGVQSAVVGDAQFVVRVAVTDGRGVPLSLSSSGAGPPLLPGDDDDGRRREDDDGWYETPPTSAAAAVVAAGGEAKKKDGDGSKDDDAAAASAECVWRDDDDDDDDDDGGGAEGKGKGNGFSIELSAPSLDSSVEIVLYRFFGRKKKKRRGSSQYHRKDEAGRTATTVRELALMDCRRRGAEDSDGGVQGGGGDIDLLIFDSKGDVAFNAVEPYLPVIVRVSLADDDRDVLLKELRKEEEGEEAEAEAAAKEKTNEEEEATKYDKHLMVVTRGTRGDVQPFLALARGLAELRNWHITIVTELAFKSAVSQNSRGLKAGRICWRPSGGDTMTRVQAPLSQKAINMKITAKQSNVMQKIFLARSECEFFPSEPAVFYWAKEMKPDYLMFGFTMINLAMIASEALKIPLLGFVLQPTSIPSEMFPPVVPLQQESYDALLGDRELVTERHDHFKLLKYVMEKLPSGVHGLNDSKPIVLEGGLGYLRTRRGLREFNSYKTNAWQELLDGNYPLIVPINETLFGGKPADWSEKAVFTDCIFLRGDTVPPIAPDAQQFLDKARGMDGKVVVLAFSSMPVSKSQIVSIALKLIRECRPEKVCVFALVGAQIDSPLDKKVRAEARAALDSGRLFLAKGSPFGRLFPLVDAVVLHGGLGTTSEAIQAQVPAIVTGVLLLDQRFWGSRCAALDVGPFGTHIVDFPEKCVEYVNKAVAEKSEWRNNARKIGRQIMDEAKDDPSGVRRNVECVVKMSEEAVPYRYNPENEERRGVRAGLMQFFRDKHEEWWDKKNRKNKNASSPEEFDSSQVAYVTVMDV